MTFTSVNPHAPADVVGEWEAAGSHGADAAVGRALKAAQVWRDTPGAARAKALGDAATALEQRAGEVTDLVIREVGKPVSEARGEVARGVAILRYYAQAALAPDGETLPAADPDQLLFARHVPVGVAALLTPWNFPVAIPLWKAAPSLAYGNATLLKPVQRRGSHRAAAERDHRAVLAGRRVPGRARRRRDGPAAGRPPGGGGRVLYRVVGGRPGYQRAGRRPRLPGAGRDGRAEPVGGAGRCRPGPRRGHHRVRGDGLRGAEVHRDQPGHRGRRGLPAVP